MQEQKKHPNEEGLDDFRMIIDSKNQTVEISCKEIKRLQVHKLLDDLTRITFLRGYISPFMSTNKRIDGGYDCNNQQADAD